MRIKQLDGVRALAILAVLLHHSLGVKMMWMGVDLFFILSGFLITGVLLNARNRDLGAFFARFYARRAQRILAPYLIFLALASLFIGVGWLKHWYLYILLTNFLFTLGLECPQPFVVLWSLAVEEQFYLFWPFAVYFLDVRRLRYLCVALIVLAPLLRGLFHFHYHWAIYELTPFRMDTLAAGALLQLEWRERRDRIERWGLALSAPLFLAGIGLLLALSHFGITPYGNTRTGNVLIYEACLLICLSVLVYALGGRGVRWMEFPVLTYLGKVSYSMYLVHLGILVLVFRWVGGVEGALIAFALTVFYATVSWYALELRLTSKEKRPPSVPELDLLHQ